MKLKPFTAGIIAMAACSMLIQDIVGQETYTHIVTDWWVTPWVTVPFAIVGLLYAIFFQEKQLVLKRMTRVEGVIINVKNNGDLTREIVFRPPIKIGIRYIDKIPIGEQDIRVYDMIHIENNGKTGAILYRPQESIPFNPTTCPMCAGKIINNNCGSCADEFRRVEDQAY